MSSKFDRNEESTVSGIHKFIAKVRETRFVIDAPRRKRVRTVRISENSEAVAEYLRKNPSTLACHRSQELNISMHPLQATVWCGLWSGRIIGPYFENVNDSTKKRHSKKRHIALG